MKLFSSPHERDLELLSQYLDGQLTADEQTKLESRFAAEPALNTTLSELRAVKAQLRSLPTVQPPRNFTLTRQMAGQRQMVARQPVLRWATAVAAVVLAVVLATDFMLSSPRSAAAPDPQAMSAAVEQASAVTDMPAIAAAPVEEASSQKQTTPSPDVRQMTTAAPAMAPGMGGGGDATGQESEGFAYGDANEPLTGAAGGGGAADSQLAATEPPSTETPVPTSAASPAPTTAPEPATRVPPDDLSPLRIIEWALAVTLGLLLYFTLRRRQR